MNNTQQPFFALLRSGLWNSPVDTRLFSAPVEWNAILARAMMQTVGGVLFDGINKLPPEIQPPAELMRKLYQFVIRIEQSHQLLNQRLTEVVPLLQSKDIHPVLFKGQGLAQNYPDPIRRQCGDIDLYIGCKDYERACKIVQESGLVSNEEMESIKHYHFRWNGVAIELHRIAEHLYNPIYNKRFQAWTKYHLHSDKLRIWNVNGTQVSLPPVNFDALYIFYHAYHHFISGGIGMRQLCDWSIYLHTFSNQIDNQELLRDLRSFGLLRAWQIFGHIAVDELGLPKEDFPFYTGKYKAQSRKVLNKIFQTGNFGTLDPDRTERPPGYFSGKLHSFINKQKWVVDIFSVFPRGISMFYMYYWYNGIKNILRGR